MPPVGRDSNRSRVDDAQSFVQRARVAVDKTEHEPIAFHLRAFMIVKEYNHWLCTVRDERARAEQSRAVHTRARKPSRLASPATAEMACLLVA